MLIIDTARIVLRRRVHVMVRCPSVCVSHLSTAATECGGFAAGRSAGRKYRSTAAAAQQHIVQQMRAVSHLQPPQKAEQTCSHSVVNYFRCANTYAIRSLPQELHVQSSQILCACYIWPLLSPPAAALRYVIYFRLCGSRHLST